MVQSANITVRPSTLWLYVLCSMGNTLWTVVHILDWHRAPTHNTLVAHFCWICVDLHCIVSASDMCSVPVFLISSNAVCSCPILVAQCQCCMISSSVVYSVPILSVCIYVCAQKLQICFVSSLLPLQQYKYIYYCFFFFTSFNKVTSALALSSFCTR